MCSHPHLHLYPHLHPGNPGLEFLGQVRNVNPNMKIRTIQRALGCLLGGSVLTYPRNIDLLIWIRKKSSSSEFFSLVEWEHWTKWFWKSLKILWFYNNFQLIFIISYFNNIFLFYYIIPDSNSILHELASFISTTM